MRRIFSVISLIFLAATSSYASCGSSVVAPFRFALLTDIHISSVNPTPLEDLRRSVDDINGQDSLAFVLVSGDITEAGDLRSMELAKTELDRLHIPYHITSGNHETTWSESGMTDFSRVFGSERFSFFHNGVFFFGFNTGPVLKMADGHVSPQDIKWMHRLLDSVGHHMTVIPVTHYPLQTGDVDNWFEVTDLLRRYNVPCVLGGHYHRNLIFNCDGIPDILCRSNLRGKEDTGGYSVISVSRDSLRIEEKRPGSPAEEWIAIPITDTNYGKPDRSLRPDYSVNRQYSNVRELWQVRLGAAVYSAPAYADGKVYVGDEQGYFYCLSIHSGKQQWRRKTGSRINSVAAVAEGKVVVGSTDGNICCFNAADGTDVWTYETGKAVMGCPVITRLPDNGEQAVLIGGSDGCFRALALATGKQIWCYNGLKGYVVTRPCLYEDKVYFGAWDCHFYALNLADGSLAWSWSNGHPSDKYSPAAVWPVAADGKIFIVAPDRVFTSLNAATGEVVYRTKEHIVRESIGISAGGDTVYSRCMWDSVVAMDAHSDRPHTLWKTSAGYGYDHNPSMMIYNAGRLLFGTKNGLLHSINAATGEVMWRHKIGNSVLNTVCPVTSNTLLVSSTEGTVTLLSYK